MLKYPMVDRNPEEKSSTEGQKISRVDCVHARVTGEGGGRAGGRSGQGRQHMGFCTLGRLLTLSFECPRGMVWQRALFFLGCQRHTVREIGCPRVVREDGRLALGE